MGLNVFLVCCGCVVFGRVLVVMLGLLWMGRGGFCLVGGMMVLCGVLLLVVVRTCGFLGVCWLLRARGLGCRDPRRGLEKLGTAANAARYY